MAYGNNKGLAKGGKKGMKKKQVDPFTKKVWYDVKCPSYIAKVTRAGRTMVTKTQGMRVETEGLKGRVCEFNLADLKESEDTHSYKKIKLEVQEIQGKNCLTDFHGLDLTRDKMCFLVKKKHTLIETWADCKTTDGYVVRIFCIAFTKEVPNHQVKQFTYAQTAQVRKIRKKIVQVLQTEVAGGQLKDMVSKLCLDSLENTMKQATTRIFPLDPIHIYKVKIVKKPKVDITKLLEVHDKDDGDGVPIEGQKEEAAEAKNLLA
jgi:small subunit ribosomal protein S3Ae